MKRRPINAAVAMCLIVGSMIFNASTAYSSDNDFYNDLTRPVKTRFDIETESAERRTWIMAAGIAVAGIAVGIGLWAKGSGSKQG